MIFKTKCSRQTFFLLNSSNVALSWGRVRIVTQKLEMETQLVELLVEFLEKFGTMLIELIYNIPSPNIYKSFSLMFVYF